MSEVNERDAHPATGGPAGMPPQVRMLQLACGSWVAQAVSVFARLGVADVLSAGPRRTDEIAAVVGAHPQTLYRLLRALSDYDVVTELDGKRFALAALGETLRHGVPGSCAGMMTMIGSRFQWLAWGDLYESLRTGEPAFARVFGVPIFEYLREHPDDAAIFNAAMSEISEMEIATSLPLYDFGRFRTIVDVGGGHGRLLAAILDAHPGVNGVLFDQPDVVAGAGDNLSRFGERCRVAGGDFFQSVPSGGDGYILRNVIVDWGDEQAVAILRTCRSAMGPGTTLLLMQGVLSDLPRPDPLNKILDIQMLVTAENGRQRTRGEFAELLERAGFRLIGVNPGASVSVVEAVPA